MIRADDIVAAVATSLNLPLAEVKHTARYLREHDLFVRETKSPRSWRAGAADAASLFAAVLSGAALVRVPEAVLEMKEFAEPDPANALALESMGFLPYGFAEFFRCAPNFVDALQVLIDLCEGSTEEKLNQLSGSFVEYETYKGIARIVMAHTTPAHFAVPPSRSEYVLWYNSEGMQGDYGALTQTRRIDLSAFRQTARVIARA